MKASRTPLRPTTAWNSEFPGYSPAHAMMMMIPEAWEQHMQMDESRRAFYEYHAAMMEPWMVFSPLSRLPMAADRRHWTAMACAPPATWSPMTPGQSWRSEAGSTLSTLKPHRQEVAPAAGQDVPDRPGTGRIIIDRRNQAATGQQPPVPPMDRAPA